MLGQTRWGVMHGALTNRLNQIMLVEMDGCESVAGQ